MPSPPQALRHILLIDAEAYAWSVVQHALGEDRRISTVAFRSAALRILNKDPPDLILVDFGPSAVGLLLAIYGLRREVPVVMATSDYKLARRLMRLGCDVVRKPYSPPELRTCR